VSSVHAAFLPDPEPDRSAAGGRPRKATAADRFACARLKASGLLSARQLARSFGVHRDTVYQWMEELMAEDSHEGRVVRDLYAELQRMNREVRHRR
jgi:transposase-like protein